MEIQDLLGIGRLGGRDADGFHHVMIKPHFKTAFSELTDCFLIFNSDRVFYVTICEKKTVDKKTWIRFIEDGIAEERKLHKEVILAIEAPESEIEDESMNMLLGYKAQFNDSVLGEVVDYFFNSAQYVLVIETASGDEVLVPYVDHYIQSVVHAMKIVILQNAQSLIEL